MAALGWRFGAVAPTATGARSATFIAELAQRLGEAGGAESARAHVGAAPAGAGFDRGRDENAGLRTWVPAAPLSFRQSFDETSSDGVAK